MLERLFKPAILLTATLAAHSALAITALRTVQVSASAGSKDGDRVDLVFDGKVGKTQVRTEFFNDVIQVSLTDVSVYPAKISSVNGNDLVKIFAYQYAPKLVRCRFTVKGKAEDFKDKLEINANGRVMSVRVGGVRAAAASSKAGESDRISAHQAHPAPAPEAGKADASGKARADDAAEKSALLDHVMGTISAEKEKPAKAAARETSKKEAASKAEKADRVDEPVELGRGARNHDQAEKSVPLAGGKPLPSPLGVFVKLALVLGLFGAIALVMKRLSRNHASKVSANHQLSARLNARLGATDGAGWMGALGGLATGAAKGLGRLGSLGSGDKLIEVVSNHSLGPKKSIAVVKVMGRLLVLGVSNDAINLITQIEEGQSPEDIDLASLAGGGGDVADSLFGPSLGAGVPKKVAAASARAAAQQMGYGATSAGPSVFSNMLKEEQAKPQAAPGASSVRSQIKSRLEGMKQL